MPQVACYVYAYIRLLEQGAVKEGEKINIVVPTGNFGNILAAYYAKNMGIPVNRFICASNKINLKILSEYPQYMINREIDCTNSPSMDILISSKIPNRLLYHLSGGDGAAISKLMEDLENEKRYQVMSALSKKKCLTFSEVSPMKRRQKKLSQKCMKNTVIS